MNWLKLLEGKSIRDAKDIADNWYTRLNNMKEKYGSPLDGIENERAERLILLLVSRLTYLSHAIFMAEMPVPSSYAKGGIQFGTASAKVTTVK